MARRGIGNQTIDDEEAWLATENLDSRHAVAESVEQSGKPLAFFQRRSFLLVLIGGLVALCFLTGIGYTLQASGLENQAPAEIASAAVALPLPAGALEWDRSTRLGHDGPHSCSYLVASYSPSVRLCLRPYEDLVSMIVRQSGDWHECRDLSSLWHSSFLQASALKDDVFFDIGSNIGLCTMHMAFNTDARQVVAFEPSAANLFYLTGSLLANDKYTRHVSLYPMGLGESAVDLPIFAQPDNAGHTVIGSALGEKGKAVPIKVGTTKVRRLDDIVRPPYPNIRLMKIDVEGFETHVLRGGRELMSSGAVRSVYFELSPFLTGQGSSRLELVNLFLEFGFEYKDLNGLPMSNSTLYHFACYECPNCFSNLFVVVAHHSPNTTQKQLPPCLDHAGL